MPVKRSLTPLVAACALLAACSADTQTLGSVGATSGEHAGPGGAGSGASGQDGTPQAGSGAMAGSPAQGGAAGGPAVPAGMGGASGGAGGAGTLLVEAIAAGSGHACALFESGQVKCWGSNSHGSLGIGDAANRGANHAQMGDNLPFLDLGTEQKASALAVGYRHACALLAAGQVKCWGSNGYGQLGLGEDSGRGKSPGEMGDNLPPVDLGAGLQVVSLAAGGDHTCALFSNQRLKCWGDNNYGELGQGDRQSRGNTPGSMGDHLPFVVFGKATSP